MKSSPLRRNRRRKRTHYVKKSDIQTMATGSQNKASLGSWALALTNLAKLLYDVYKDHQGKLQ